MDKLYNKTHKMVEIADIIFTLLFLTVGFLQFCSLTYGKSIISWVQWPTVFLGIILVCYRLLFFKKFIKVKGIILLVGFALSYGISMLVNFKYGFYENFRGLIFIVFQFGILYAFNTESDSAVSKKKFFITSFFFMGVVAVLSVLSVYYMLNGVSEIYTQEVGPTYVVGFAWGRLFGAYWDPNIAATMNSVAVLLSVYFITKFKNIFARIAFAVNIVINVLYVTFSDSRTGIVTLTIATTVFAGFYLFNKGFGKLQKNGLRIVACLGVLAVIAGMGFKVPGTVKSAYNSYTAMLNEQIRAEQKEDEATDEKDDKDEKPKKELPAISSDGRTEDVSSDISNRRFDIWKNSVELFLTTPIVGTSHFNIVAYAEDVMPESYILTNSHLVFSTMHNFVFDVLVSQGILGIVTIFGAAIIMVIFFFKKFKVFNNGKNAPFNYMLLALAVTVLASSMFMTEIVYTITPITLMFWLALGTLMHNLQKEEVEVKQ